MRAGERRFGENYVQEGVAKIDALAELRAAIEWHLIGPLQSNKTRVVAEHFDWVQSIDRLKIAERLSTQRPAHLAPLQLCLQVNISGEAQQERRRAGRGAGAGARGGRAAAAAPARPDGDSRAGRRASRRSAGRTRRCASCCSSCSAKGWTSTRCRSGMSADLEAAIAEGATMVRIGSAIFGARASAQGLQR